MKGILTGKALSLSYYENAALAAWVQAMVQTDPPDAVLLYSGAMGQFVKGILPDHIPVVFIAEDVDSEKWKA